MSDTRGVVIEAIDACESAGLEAPTVADLRALATCEESSRGNTAGLVRMLRACTDDHLYVVTPNWRMVRALHHAWLAAQAWEFEEERP